MSHFSTFVFVDKSQTDGSRESIEQCVDKLLEPFDEHRVVPKYQRKCGCNIIYK